MATLTPDQQQVANHGDGHARVPAVPGAGKTTTMVQLILNKLSAGVDPRRIRIVMFNRSAQEDFTAKLSKAANGQYPILPTVKTFHAMGRSLLLSFVSRGAVPALDPAPMSEIHASIAAYNVLKEFAPDHLAADIEEKRQQWAQAFSGFIDMVKAGLKSPKAVFHDNNYDPEHAFFIEAFEQFELWRRQHGKVTFADLLYEPCQALANNAELLSSVENLIDVIIVDEFQDINEIQLFLLRCLAGRRAQLIVVGDADQCIYEFRAARPHYMTAGFGEIYDHRTYTIGQTFRYGHRLALAANHLIANNQHREPVMCLSGPSTPETSITLHNQSSTADELADQYGELLQHGYNPQDIVVLCRAWSLSAPVELAFLKRGIHHRVQGGRPVLKQPEIEALITVLHIANGSFRSLPLSGMEARVFNLLKISLQRIKHTDLKAVALHIANASDDPIDALASACKLLSTYQAKKLARLVETLQHAASTDNAGEVLERYIEGASVKLNVKGSCIDAEEGETRVETVEAFTAFVSHQNPGDLRQVTSLMDELLNQDSQHQTSSAVVITTMHRSKGLEWPVVLIPGLDDKHMPYRREGELPDPEHDESERRLLYVAMTRAKEQLHLFAPGFTNHDGLPMSDGLAPTQIPSPFLAEMHLGLSNALGGALHAKASEVRGDIYVTPVGIQYARESGGDCRLPAPAGLSLLHSGKGLIGQPVAHKVHGLGKIVNVRRDGLVCEFHGASRLFPRVVAEHSLSFATKAAEHPSTRPPARIDTLSVGQAVDHRRFGRGEIADLDEGYVYVRFGKEHSTKAFRRESFVAA